MSSTGLAGTACGIVHSVGKLISSHLINFLQFEIVYKQKQHIEEVLSLALENLKLHQNAWKLKERYFGTQNYMVQEGRMHYVYENILIETESVQIEHFRTTPKDIKSAITHSKCYITRVLHIHEWGLDPTKSRILKLNNSNYNYWDYIQA